MSDPRLPEAPYVPGQTPRHPEDWFDALKQDQSTALRAGLDFFEAGYFWECHEVLEAVWMQSANPSPERDMVQAVIQLANARLKLVMGRPKAARRLCDIVADLLARIPDGTQPFGLDPYIWHALLTETRVQAG